MTAADREPTAPRNAPPTAPRNAPPNALPSGLRERVLAASLRARAAGRPFPDAPEISPVEAFGRAASAFYAVLCVLSDEDWRTQVLRGLDVQGLVGHLIGVEDDVHRALAGDPEVASADHVESTQAAAELQATRPPAQTRDDWRRAADRTLDLTRPAATNAADRADTRADNQAGTENARVAMHGMRLPASTLLIVRAFELWTHENDIRQAIGLAPSVPDPSTLRLMTDLAARLLPHVGSELDEPVDVRLVLTGPGGGTWDVTMGGPPPAPAAVSIVADAVGFCRLAANRIAPADLDASITGDPAHAAAILAATTTLALD